MQFWASRYQAVGKVVSLFPSTDLGFRVPTKVSGMCFGVGLVASGVGGEDSQALKFQGFGAVG